MPAEPSQLSSQNQYSPVSSFRNTSTRATGTGQGKWSSMRQRRSTSAGSPKAARTAGSQR